MVTALTFISGCLLGWLTNHWYAVNLRRPQLSTNGGGGGGVDLNGSGYRFVSISIENNLRHIGFTLPRTVILGRRIKTRFGRQLIARDPALSCAVNLLDEHGVYLTQLWWTSSTRSTLSQDIICGKPVTVIPFVRNQTDPSQYYVYRPMSPRDSSPNTAEVAHFNKTTSFQIEVSYSYGSLHLRIPAQVKILPDDNFYFETTTGGSSF